MRKHSFARTAAVGAAGALAVGLLTAAPTQAAEPAPSATTWLVGQLTDGLLFNGAGTSALYGPSIDAGLALVRVGGHAAAVDSMHTAFVTKQKSYYDYEYDYDSDTNGTPEHYTGTAAGSVAKLATFVAASGRDPRNYGGVDLINRVEQLTTPSGRIQDRAFKDGVADPTADYANTIGQAFAARSLSVSGSGRAADATTFLLSQQCASGYFREGFSAPGAAQQGCVEGAAGSAPSPDATAMIVLHLSAIPNRSAATNQAIAKSVAWLTSQQQPDGFIKPGTNAPINANTTGLAAWALAEGGSCLAAGKSANAIRTLQVQPTATGPLAGQIGAIAYGPASYTAAQTDGIVAAKRTEWRFATAQAAPALLSTLSQTLTDLTGPTGYVRAGSTQKLSANGLSAGDNVCFTDADGVVSSLHAPTTAATKTVTLPSGTGSTTYSVAIAGIEKQVTVKRLGELTFKPTAAKKKVRKGAKQRVIVKDLAASEKVIVRVNGKRVAKGTATAAGKFVAKFKVSKKLAHKKKATVKVVGEFSDLRKGQTTFRVVKRKPRR